MSHAMNKAAGTDYVPKSERPWVDGAPQERRGRPQLRVIENPKYAKRSSRAGSRRKSKRAEALCKALKYVLVVMLAVGFMVQIGRYAQMAGQTKQIAKLNTEIRNLENDHENLEVRLSARENINRVREEAINRLGMAYPTEGQVQVVNRQGDSSEKLTQTADSGMSGAVN